MPLHIGFTDTGMALTTLTCLTLAPRLHTYLVTIVILITSNQLSMLATELEHVQQPYDVFLLTWQGRVQKSFADWGATPNRHVGYKG